MIRVLQILRKPYDFLVNLYSSSKTQQTESISSNPPNVFTAILSPIETYVVSLQSLLIWERPCLSATAFVTVNILYWLIVSWNRRFLSIVSIFLLALFLYRTWTKHIWPEIRVPPSEDLDSESWITLNPEVLSVPEISRYLNDFLEKMITLWKDVWKLRRENRGLFCCFMCGFFSITAFIGRIFPGVLIVYFILLLLTLGPGVALHLIPSTVYDQIIGYFSETESQVSPDASKSSGRDSDLEEFVPEMSPEVLRLLTLKEDNIPEIPSPGRVLPDHHGEETFESDDFSLYQGLGSFPSVEEECESDLEEELSSQSIPKEEDHLGMHFNLQHFKEDSSESGSESAFTEGLSFEKAKETPEDEKGKISSDLEDDLMDFEILEGADVPP